LDREFSRVVSLPPSATRVALLDHGEHQPVIIWDWKRKAVTRQIARWTGQLTADGRYGLYAPSRGGLDLIDIKSGEVALTLIPRVAEGVFSIKAMFTTNNRHVIYYHSGHRTIRVFRVADGHMVRIIGLCVAFVVVILISLDVMFALLAIR
jgi:NACHT domain- and WD repeat-containing protein